MAGNLEQIILEVLLKDRASEGLGRTSGAARLAGENVSTLNKKLDEVSKKTAEARVKLAGDKDAQASLDKLDTKLLSLDRRTANPRITVEGAARTLAEISAVNAELDKLGNKSDGTAKVATSALGAGGLAGPAGMGALVAGGVALSPVIATLGVGLGGLALAGLSVAKNTKLMGQELQPLKAEFSGFAKSLQPEILDAFGAGITIARHGLHDIQPVAAATGKALSGVLGQIDAEFQSGQWQQFFAFMAREAGPDLRLVGNLFVQLAADIPPLLIQLQPLAEGFLKDADAVLKLVNATTQAVAWEHKHADAVSNSTGWLGKFEHAAVNAFTQMFPGVKAAKALQDQLAKTGSTTDATSGKVRTLGGSAQAAAVRMQTLAAQVNGLTNAENKALSPLLAYTGALITQRTDADKLNTALKASHDRIGLNTDAQRASFSAANTYIQDLLNTASAAVKSHQGIDAQISSIRNALPALQNVKGGTRQYWQEVSTLVGWLHRLQQIKRISEAIHVSGTGVWTVTPGKIGLPGGSAGGPFASGGLVTAGTGPRSDDVVARVSRGELIVPANLVSAGVVDHLRGMLPGFASGGVVGSWGQLPGLGPWAGRELRATESAIGRSVAQALIAGIRAAASAASAGAPGALGGPASASAAQAQAYAASRLGAYGWSSAQMKFLIELWTRESGWNRFARNPSSGAYGIPQALPPGKMGAAANPPVSSAAAQINWGLGYIRGRYGSPQGAWGHELSFGWYDQGGMLPPGLTLAYNGTGRAERVGVGGNTYIITVNMPFGSTKADVENGLVRVLDQLDRQGRLPGGR